MKYLDEFGDAELARVLFAEIEKIATKPWSIMEVCGGQTHSIIRNGIDQLLPDSIRLIHGPGCPVCVTPLGVIDKALALAARPDVIFCSFGDMLRVPGSDHDLFTVKSRGGDVRIVYSPLDAVALAEQNPDRQVVLLRHRLRDDRTRERDGGARREAARASELLGAGQPRAGAAGDRRDRVVADGQVDGFLAAGHVCSVMGTREYGPLVERHGVPIVVTASSRSTCWRGFAASCCSWKRGEARLENAYPRVVSEVGNVAAQGRLQDVFAVCDRQWRGIGEIPQSGWGLSPAYAEYDAARRSTSSMSTPTSRRPVAAARCCSV